MSWFNILFPNHQQQAVSPHPPSHSHLLPLTYANVDASFILPGALSEEGEEAADIKGQLYAFH